MRKLAHQYYPFSWKHFCSCCYEVLLQASNKISTAINVISSLESNRTNNHIQFTFELKKVSVQRLKISQIKHSNNTSLSRVECAKLFSLELWAKSTFTLAVTQHHLFFKLPSQLYCLFIHYFCQNPQGRKLSWFNKINPFQVHQNKSYVKPKQRGLTHSSMLQRQTLDFGEEGVFSFQRFNMPPAGSQAELSKSKDYKLC